MTENNHPSATAPQISIEPVLSTGSPRYNTKPTVTLELVPIHEDDIAPIQQKVQGAAMVRIEPAESSDSEMKILEVFRKTYSSLPPALEAARLLPSQVQRYVDVATVLDERQVLLLARYHIRSFLNMDRALRFYLNNSGYWDVLLREYVPSPYHELTWPQHDGFNFSHEMRPLMYHLRRLAGLESILGAARMSRLYESMATYWPEAETFYFDSEGSEG